MAPILLLVALLLVALLSPPAQGKCDLYAGKWVDVAADIGSTSTPPPLYDVSECPFVEKVFDCVKNGRTDMEYLRYRWQPSGCELPRFNVEDFLTKLRGKKMMFVGDSLSLNQWQSLTCMLYVSSSQLTNNNSYTLTRRAELSIFTIPAYDAQIIFSRNAFLVDMANNGDDVVMKLDSVAERSKDWLGIDFLIFNTWHWWLHTGRKQSWKIIEEGNRTYQDMDRLEAYEKALRTWADWIDANVNPATTKVFFQGVSPDHTNGSEWGEATASNCRGQTQPSEYDTDNYPAAPHPAQVILEKVLRQMSKPVHLLNITALSRLRKDGHPSVYSHGGHMAMDCSHWCLAGVPDTWNHLLYASILQD
ncbi:Protein trichome birefringence-like 43 [Linum perenne]